MPVYTISEFAKLVGIEPKNIHTQIVRKKLVKNKNGQIDTSNAKNSAFLLCSKKDTTKAVKTTPKTAKNTPQNNEVSTDEKEENNEFVSIDLKMQRLRVEKLQKENDIKDEELKRKKGEVIDLESTLSIVSTYSEALKKEFSLQIQTHIQDICARHGIEPEKSGEYKLKVIEIINESSKKSISILRELKK